MEQKDSYFHRRTLPGLDSVDAPAATTEAALANGSVDAPAATTEAALDIHHAGGRGADNEGVVAHPADGRYAVVLYDAGIANDHQARQGWWIRGCRFIVDVADASSRLFLHLAWTGWASRFVIIRAGPVLHADGRGADHEGVLAHPADGRYADQVSDQALRTNEQPRRGAGIANDLQARRGWWMRGARFVIDVADASSRLFLHLALAEPVVFLDAIVFVPGPGSPPHASLALAWALALACAARLVIIWARAVLDAADQQPRRGGWVTGIRGVLYAAGVTACHFLIYFAYSSDFHVLRALIPGSREMAEALVGAAALFCYFLRPRAEQQRPPLWARGRGAWLLHIARAAAIFVLLASFGPVTWLLPTAPAAAILVLATSFGLCPAGNALVPLICLVCLAAFAALPQQ